MGKVTPLRAEEEIVTDIRAALDAGEFGRVAALRAELSTQAERATLGRLQELRAELVTLEAEYPAAKDEQKRLGGETQAAREREEAAHKEWALALRLSRAASERLFAMRERRRALLAEIEQLTGELTGRAEAERWPIVRSRPHAAPVS